jgi:hypothetical protein
MADELFRNICGRLLKMSAGQDVLRGGNELDGGVGRRWGKGEEARRLPQKVFAHLRFLKSRKYLHICDSCGMRTHT